MSNANWHWPAIGLGFTADGSVMRKLFAGSKLSDAGLLARESIQNSTDAARESELVNPGVPFRVEFRFVELTGDAKHRVVEAMRFGQLAQQSKKYGKRNNPILDGSILEDPKALANSKTPLRLLFVEDFGTQGLYGDPKTHAKSHFYKAMYAIGANNKDLSAGGSYGFGKSAIARASSTSTMFGFSAFDTRGLDKVQSRLIGFTWWGNLEDPNDESKSFTGVGSFANWREGVAGMEPHPFEDAEAIQLAGDLGFAARNPKKPEDWGASFMIVDPISINAQDLKREIEKWWWPRLEDHALDVRIIDERGDIIVPEPASNPFVAQYLKPYRIAIGLDVPTDNKKERLASSDWGKNGDFSAKDLGTLGLVVTPDPFGENGEPTKSSKSQVALIRGPRMVVTYLGKNTKGPALRGAFVASYSANEILRKVEPDQHDDWTDKGGDLPLDARKMAGAVKDQIKAALDKMAADAVPVLQSDKQALNHFAKLMSGFFGTSKGPTKPPKVGGERVEIHFVNGRPTPEVVDESTVRISTTFAVKLAEKAQDATLRVRVSCPITVVEDEGSASSHWGVKIEPVENNGGFQQISDGSWVGHVDKLDRTIFRAITDNYPNQWTVAIQPTVERLSEGAAL